MKAPYTNPSERVLNNRQQLIKQFIIIPARNNARYHMESFLMAFTPRLKYASPTNKEAYNFILNEYNKIFDNEFSPVRMFPNTEKPEEELIGDIDLTYLQSYPSEQSLSTFLTRSPEVSLIATELTASMHITNRLNYLRELLNEPRFAPFSQPATEIAPKRKPRSKPAEANKLKLWKDVMQSEELATKILKLLEDKGYVRVFEGKCSWLDQEGRPFQVLVALAETLHRKGYFKEPFKTIHAKATINQFQSSYAVKNLDANNRWKAFDKYGKEFHFIPEPNKL